METVVFQTDDDLQSCIDDSENAEGIIKYFIRSFVKRPGQHLLELGSTGTGKTNFLFWLVDMFREHAPNEAIVWFDIGKAQYNPKTNESGNEILTLLYYFGAVRIITMTGCDVRIVSEREYDVEYVHVDNPEMIWKYCKPDRLNIVSFDPFILNDVIHASVLAKVFERLIWLANRGWLWRPMAIFYDEFHNVCPSQGHGIYEDRKAAAIQKKTNNQFKKNLQKLRSTGVRFVASTHQWTQLYKSVRLSFEWLVPRRRTLFTGDAPDLARFNPRWKKMKTYQAYLVIPEGDHLGPFRCLFYKIPPDLGSVEYDGIYAHTEKDKLK
ncbi:hypothetical protein F1737_04415 [Methanoplanus sp. FWC-SCC4]|uniref:Uncharacterized protein n=1 Tax=Methanochimaera problematica TaxID=2609417 RepID=A0AA97FBP6_9EURY|nr:hypothetical protein [Methanoplanus sp. FWC-SCC4]WOF15999.1 hypothetical protein F1737_04415 [Methanoplanus sp. FWC-SCC4]